MADILMFKSEKAKDDFWDPLERKIRGWFRLDGLPQELAPAIIERTKAIYQRSQAAPGVSLELTTPSTLLLTPEEWEAARLEIEQKICDKAYPQFCANVMEAIFFEVVVIEAELYKLRNGIGAPGAS